MSLQKMPVSSQMSTLNNLIMASFPKQNSTRPLNQSQSVRPRVNPGDEPPKMIKELSSSRISVKSLIPRFFTKSVDKNFSTKSVKPVTSPQINQSGTVKLIRVSQIKMVSKQKKPSITLTPQQEQGMQSQKKQLIIKKKPQSFSKNQAQLPLSLNMIATNLSNLQQTKKQPIINQNKYCSVANIQQGLNIPKAVVSAKQKQTSENMKQAPTPKKIIIHQSKQLSNEKRQFSSFKFPKKSQKAELSPNMKKTVLPKKNPVPLGDSQSFISNSRNQVSPRLNQVSPNNQNQKTQRKSCDMDIMSNFSDLCDVASEDWNKKDKPAKFSLNCAYKTQIVQAAAQQLDQQCICQNECDDMCTRLNARQQRKVIYNILLNERHSSNQTGQKRYIINSAWWRRWCDYVNLNEDCDDNMLPLSVSLCSLSTEKHGNTLLYEKPGMIKNSRLLDDENTEDTNFPIQKFTEHYVTKLKPGLVEHFDFQSVSASVWKHLNAWYGVDYKICRRLVSDVQSVKLDLYPEENNIRLITQTSQQKQFIQLS